MSEPLTAPINKILPYSVVDGPGNRVAIFFQRCNIHCDYCHNPETQNLCRNCGACVEECPGKALRMVNGQVCWAAEKCLGCDRCIQVCPNRASPKVTEMTPEQVFERICESLPFIRGITVSGGECSLYPEFLEKLFLLTREKHLTALMDCNGTIDLSRYPELMALCDGVMLDVKSWDPEAFSSLTGGSGKNVKKNLLWLSQQGNFDESCADLAPNIALIEKWNHAADDRIRVSLAPHSEGATTEKVLLKLIRFRHFGVRGELSNWPSPSMETMLEWKDLAIGAGFRRILVL
mgnify:CR=1 FL=1